MTSVQSSTRRRPRVPRWWVLGPGLMVMLADTDAGSVITASQSGARWGYRLLALQVVLVPVLYLVMELTVRLGDRDGQGPRAADPRALRRPLGVDLDRRTAGERVRRAGDGVRRRSRGRAAVRAAAGG